MKIAICDDDRLLRERLGGAVQDYLRNCSVRLFSCGEELLKHMTEFDVVFLDIEMPGLNGMQTAEHIRKLNKEIRIIFLTSHAEFMQDAFRVRAFRYLNKPVKSDALYEALAEAQNEISEKEKIIIRQKGRIWELELNHILYLEAFGDGTYVYDIHQNVYSCSVQLKEWTRILSEKGFFQIHRTYLISLLYVQSIEKNQLKLMYSDIVFPIARRKISGFKSAYLQYVQEHAKII
ncbi:MAG: response regulator transcription factor [Oscillospiraceae bacterium]|nr:response regulator transcription factor [Oscillospiraceae bacterium]